VALGILGKENTNIKLVNDQVVKWRSPRTSIRPGIRVRIPDHAVVLRAAVPLQSTRIRIALEPFAAGAHDPESVLGAIGNFGKKAGPVPIGILDQQVSVVFYPSAGGRRSCLRSLPVRW
jgi:hypothetical protein